MDGVKPLLSPPSLGHNIPTLDGRQNKQDETWGDRPITHSLTTGACQMNFIETQKANICVREGMMVSL